MKTFLRLFVVVSLALMSLPPPVICQNTDIPWDAFDGGFAVSLSASTSLTSALGQGFVDPMQQGNTIIKSGFLGAFAGAGAIVSVKEDENLPRAFALLQNYPNPFNPSTTIRFDVPQKTVVKLTVFNVLGQEVISLVNEEKNPGSYDIRFNASRFSSGVYFYTMQAGAFTQTRKLLLLK